MKTKTMCGRLILRLRTMAMVFIATSMAAPMWAAAATVNKSFTNHSIASSGLIVFGGETFNFSVSGSFVGTVKLQKSKNGVDYADLLPALSTNAAFNQNFYADAAVGQKVYYRVYASTYTSGTIVTALADVNDLTQSFRNWKGADNLQLYDDGVVVPGALTATGGLVVGPGALVQVSSSGTSGFSLSLDGAYTTAQVQAKTPARPGILIWNSTLGNVCVSTGTPGAMTIQGYKLIGTASTTCQ